jgi:steroid delta-isomerase
LARCRYVIVPDGENGRRTSRERWRNIFARRRDVAAQQQEPTMQMSYDAMMRFAEDWVAAWNRRDVDAVLGHYLEEAQFVSPVARNVVGRSVLRNKQELADYWRSALARIATLEFRLDHAAWDERRRELVVVYEANLNGERKRASEIMRFDADGRQIAGEAMYGAPL